MRRPDRSALVIALLAPLALFAACTPDEGTPADDAADAPTGEAAETAADGATTDPQEAFWANLSELCGQAYAGEIVASAPEGTDDDFAGREMVMHVRECEEDVIRIPFHVGDDRSRTWIITRTDNGLRLKHDHRHEDGSPDELTLYGGDTDSEGTATRQRFPADQETAEMLPAAATNVWTIGIEPGQAYTYELRREGTDREFRAEFDLTSPVETPPTPWGWD